MLLSAGLDEGPLEYAHEDVLIDTDRTTGQDPSLEAAKWSPDKSMLYGNQKTTKFSLNN